MKPQALLFGAAWVFGGCGPNLQSLVQAKHYREAICAAQDGDTEDRRMVGRALDKDADLHLHVHVVSKDELQPVLGYATNATIARGRILRVGMQSNVLPIDSLELQGTFVTDAGRTAGLVADWSTLALITNEKLPPNRVEQTYATGENFLKGGAAILTGGLSLLFTNFHQGNVEVQAPYSEFVRLAPHASALHNTTATAGCTAIGAADGAGRKCVWYFVLDNISRTPVAFELETSYVSLRQTGKQSPDVEEKCLVKRPIRISLGKPEDIEKTSRDLFGDKMQSVRSMVRSD